MPVVPLVEPEGVEGVETVSVGVMGVKYVPDDHPLVGPVGFT